MIKAILRRINECGLAIAITIIVAMCCVFGLLVWLALSAVGDAITSIDDPTERGLAYVAAAIVAHTLLGSKSERCEKP